MRPDERGAAITEGVRMSLTDEPNPAELLLERFSGWEQTPANQSVLDARGPDWWADHVEAVGWLEEVAAWYRQSGSERFVAGIERMREGLFAIDTRMDMAERSNRAHFRSDDLATLEVIAERWDSGSDRDEEPADGRVLYSEPVLRMHGLVTQVEALLVEAGDQLPEGTRTYLHMLVTRLRDALGRLHMDTEVNVRAATNEMIGALRSEFSDVDPSLRARVRKVAGAFERMMARHGATAALTGAFATKILELGTGG